MLRLVGALGFCLALTGCIDPAKRAIVAEENEKARDLDVPLVADITDVGNGGVMQVDGVGLVTGLQGTGHCPNNNYRKLLEQYLLKHMGKPGGEIKHLDPQVRVRDMLNDPDNCLVIVTGYIPPGARKGDRFDVHIKLPEDSKATSLAGGRLELATLRTYEWAGNLSNDPKHQSTSQLLPGHIFAHAKGTLFVGFGANSDAGELRHARIWQGGVSRIDRPYIYMMKKDQRALQYANRVAERINFMYQEDPKARARHADFSDQEKQLLLMGYTTNQLNSKGDYGMAGGDVAKASKEGGIFVRVPFAYRLDHQRFIDVSGRTPLRDAEQDLPRYRQRLQKMLLDARDTRSAAIRLEALGRDSIPILKSGLESSHPFVRFCSAEALAFLGSTAGVDVLADMARKHPVLAKNCTIALANLGESVCLDRLADMLVSEEPALRCAAFHALSLADERDVRLQGFLPRNESFWLHQISKAPSRMVYFSTAKRAQVVLFGQGITLQPGTAVIIPKDFTVTHDKESGAFRVKRITVQGEQSRTCSGNLAEILSHLADLGATYPEVVDFLRRVNDYQKVNCPIVSWNVPDVPLETLLESGRQMKSQ